MKRCLHHVFTDPPIVHRGAPPFGAPVELVRCSVCGQRSWRVWIAEPFPRWQHRSVAEVERGWPPR